jgi:hypothetical protein
VTHADFLARAGLDGRPDSDTTWVIDGPTWVRAGFVAQSLYFETPIGRIHPTPELLAEVAQLSRAWAIGRLFVSGPQLIAMVSVPCETPDGVDPMVVRRLYDHLLAAIPTLRRWEVPPTPPAEEISLAALRAMLAALELKHDVDDHGVVVGIISDGHRCLVRIAPVDGRLRLLAWPADKPATVADPVLVDVANAAATLGTLAPMGERLVWTYELLSEVVRGRPEQLALALDHAVQATRTAATMAPVREGVLLPRLLPPSSRPPGPVLPLAQISGPGVPLVGIVAADAETLEEIPVAPSHPEGPNFGAAVAALASRAVPWRREGPLLVCEGPFAAEQILVPAMLEAARRELGAEVVAVAAPRPGCLLAQAWTGPASVAALRARIGAGDATLGGEVFLARDGRIVERAVPEGGRAFAVLELVGIDPARRAVRFRHHGPEEAPLNELQMLASVAMARRLADGQAVDRVEVAFVEADAAQAALGGRYEEFGAVVLGNGA